jgi:glycine cleavage system H protein
MGEFTYTDIFDTKGIEYIIIIFFLLILIPFWRLLNKPVKVRVKAERSDKALSQALLNLPGGLFYGKNHTWAHMEKSGIARIGINDLLMHITGAVSLEATKKTGEEVKKGETVAKIKQNNKFLEIKSPVSGRIERLNTELFEYPEDLVDDPYGQGWIMKIRPDNWLSDTKSFYFGEEVQKWTREELIKLKDFLVNSGKVHHLEDSSIILQEGGEIRDFPLADMGKDTWEDFQERFLNRMV